MFGDRAQRRHEREPPRQTDEGADDRRCGSHRRAVGQHGQSDVAVGGAHGSKHAQGSQAPPRHHRESGHRQQADEEQAQCAEDEHHRLYLDGGGRTAAANGKAGAAGEPERLEALLTGVEQDRDTGRRVELPGGDEGELVEQVEGVFDQANDV